MDDGQLIDLVHSYPHLYDKKRSDFKDIRKKENSWREIGILLNYSTTDVQNRWKYLREKFSRELKTNKILHSGSEANERPPWEYFHSMSWLRTYIQPRKRTNTNDGANVESQLWMDVSESMLESSRYSLSPEREEAGEVEHSSIFAATPSTSSSTCTSGEGSSEPAPKQRRTDKQVVQTQVASTMKDVGNTMKEVVNIIKNKQMEVTEDEDELFGRMVTVLLKNKKNKKRKKELKKKIYNDLMDESDTE